MDTLTLLEMQVENRSMLLRVEGRSRTDEGHVLGFNDRLVWFKSSADGRVSCYRWSQVRGLSAA